MYKSIGGKYICPNCGQEQFPARPTSLEVENKCAEALAKLEEGYIVEGCVKSLEDKGALIDLGFMDGIVHIEDISWRPINHPKEVLKVGDTIQVKILKLDRVNYRVELGYKQLFPESMSVGTREKSASLSKKCQDCETEMYASIGGKYICPNCDQQQLSPKAIAADALTRSSLSSNRDFNELQQTIEDVRSDPHGEGEIILNLWYVTSRIVISSLRAKAYVASGTDEEKLHFLRTRANHDYRNARVFPVPEHLKADVTIDGITAGKACTHATLDFMGGVPALFREIIASTPKAGFRFDPTQALVCITGLIEEDDGRLSVHIDRSEQL
jgi:predicted RNA-binding protein with RPS1 domain